MIVILMGVSGSGKTTVGDLLAHELGRQFYDGDEFHSALNVEKMRQGIPLTDDDRRPWLEKLWQIINEVNASGESAVVACSALKRSYREHLAQGDPDVQSFYLRGEFNLIEERLKGRQDHFAKADLLESQFQTLEEPEEVFKVDINLGVEAIVSIIRDSLGM